MKKGRQLESMLELNQTSKFWGVFGQILNEIRRQESKSKKFPPQIKETDK